MSKTAKKIVTYTKLVQKCKATMTTKVMKIVMQSEQQARIYDAEMERQNEDILQTCSW